MTEDKKSSAKIHVFLGERPKYAEEKMQERAVRRRRAAEQNEKLQLVQSSGIKTAQGEQNTDIYADIGKQKKGQIQQLGKPSRYMDTAPATSVNPVAKRYRELKNERRMKLLKQILAVLILLLLIALIYEVILGHGTKQTGAQRMAQQELQKQQTMQETESES